jgi:DUF4097 and DUF4098 domain-containing protein YvlB
MPTFETNAPISVTLDVVVGKFRIAASERTDTVVDVQPTDGGHDLDVTAAAQTRVDYSKGNLVIKGPKPRGPWRKIGSVDVTIELPARSTVHGSAAMADFRSEGQLGECRLKTAAGAIRLDQTGPVHLSTAAGDVTVDDVSGNLEISTGSGTVRVREVDGAALIKNSNGETWVGDVSGKLRVNSANGSIAVDKALAEVDARTANGDVRIGEVVRGSVGLETAMGELEVGIREGTAAWLDVHTTYGAVRSSLTSADAPERSEQSVEVRARTSFGDILIHRA